MADLLERVRVDSAGIGDRFEFSVRRVRDHFLPDPVADAVVSAAVQAMTNSVKHAGGPEVHRELTVEGTEGGGVRVSILGPRQGLRPGRGRLGASGPAGLDHGAHAPRRRRGRPDHRARPRHRVRALLARRIQLDADADRADRGGADVIRVTRPVLFMLASIAAVATLGLGVLSLPQSMHPDRVVVALVLFATCFALSIGLGRGVEMPNWLAGLNAGATFAIGLLCATGVVDPRNAGDLDLVHRRGRLPAGGHRGAPAVGVRLVRRGAARCADPALGGTRRHVGGRYPDHRAVGRRRLLRHAGPGPGDARRAAVRARRAGGRRVAGRAGGAPLRAAGAADADEPRRPADAASHPGRRRRPGRGRAARVPGAGADHPRRDPRPAPAERGRARPR